MDSFLRDQVSQRASNTDRLSSLIQQTKGEQFENWRNDANNLFDAQLNDYSNKASEYIQEKIAEIKKTDAFNYIETFGNQNSNGNALYTIFQEWERQNK